MKHRLLFLIILTACLICIDMSSGLSVHCFTSALITAFVLSWPTKFLPTILRSVIQLLIGESFVFLCIVDCYCQTFLGSPITPQLFNSVLLSNFRETHEFFSGFVNSHTIVHWRIGSLLLMVFMLPIVLGVRWSPSAITNTKTFKCLWRGVVVVCLLCEAIPGFHYIQLYLQEDIEKVEGLIFRHYHEEVPTPLHRFVFAYYSILMSRHTLEKIKISTFNAKIDNCTHNSPHIVLIIGESYNKHHSSLYGYRLPTTPLQQMRQERGELILFDDAVTRWNITSNAFLDMFSVWQHDCRHPVTAYPLFPVVFRRAGYTVTFFSNQYILRGFRRGATNQSGHFFLADAELSDSMFTYRNNDQSQYDMGLVKQVKDYMRETTSQPLTLDIIHLIGQHFEYSMRYPHSQAIFSLADYKKRKLDKFAKEIVMHYDNATRYNDYVLDSLLSMYEDEEVIIVFVADHGEEVYDELPIHGRLFQEPSSQQLKNEYQVPMWIWCSESYISCHPDIVEQIRSLSKKHFTTDALANMLLYFAGIKME